MDVLTRRLQRIRHSLWRSKPLRRGRKSRHDATGGERLSRRQLDAKHDREHFLSTAVQHVSRIRPLPVDRLWTSRHHPTFRNESRRQRHDRGVLRNRPAGRGLAARYAARAGGALTVRIVGGLRLGTSYFYAANEQRTLVSGSQGSYKNWSFYLTYSADF